MPMYRFGHVVALLDEARQADAPQTPVLNRQHGAEPQAMKWNDRYVACVNEVTRVAQVAAGAADDEVAK